MAVGAWVMNKRFKRAMGRGTIVLQTQQCRMVFITSAGSARVSAAIASLSTYGSLVSAPSYEVAATGHYSTGGGTRGKVSGTWTATGTASVGQSRFSFATSRIWTAGAGSSITNIKYAVLFLSAASAHAKSIICISKLSTAQFTVTSGNTITISQSGGVFNLA